MENLYNGLQITINEAQRKNFIKEAVASDMKNRVYNMREIAENKEEFIKMVTLYFYNLLNKKKLTPYSAEKFKNELQKNLPENQEYNYFLEKMSKVIKYTIAII